LDLLRLIFEPTKDFEVEILNTHLPLIRYQGLHTKLARPLSYHDFIDLVERLKAVLFSKVNKILVAFSYLAKNHNTNAKQNTS